MMSADRNRPAERGIAGARPGPTRILTLLSVGAILIAGVAIVMEAAPRSRHDRPRAFSIQLGGPGRAVMSVRLWEDRFSAAPPESLALDGDILAAGQPGEPADGRPGAGAVYLINLRRGSLIARLQSPTPDDTEEWFGMRVALSGNRCAASTRFYGSPEFLPPCSVHVLNSLTGDPVTSVHNPDREASIAFGLSIALGGNRLVVGAPSLPPLEDSPPGRVHIFDSENGELLRTLRLPPGEERSGFGFTVALSGTRCLVSCMPVGRSRPEPDVWSGYIFDVETGDLLTTVQSPDRERIRPHWSGLAFSGNHLITDARIVDAAGRVTGSEMLHFDASEGRYVTSITTPYLNRFGEPATGAGVIGMQVAIAGRTVIFDDGTRSMAGVQRNNPVHAIDIPTGRLLDTWHAPDPEDITSFGDVLAASEDFVAIGGRERIKGEKTGTSMVWVFRMPPLP